MNNLTTKDTPSPGLSMNECISPPALPSLSSNVGLQSSAQPVSSIGVRFFYAIQFTAKVGQILLHFNHSSAPIILWDLKRISTYHFSLQFAGGIRLSSVVYCADAQQRRTRWREQHHNPTNLLISSEMLSMHLSCFGQCRRCPLSYDGTTWPVLPCRHA